MTLATAFGCITGCAGGSDVGLVDSGRIPGAMAEGGAGGGEPNDARLDASNGIAVDDAGRDASGIVHAADASGTVRASGAADAEAVAPSDAGADAAQDVVITIKNGDFWLDTSGHRIEAHGAGLIYANDAWYWIGEDRSSGNFKAVNCYRSTDLAHWEFRGAILTRQTASELAAADRIIERPKVVFNDKTQKYVMWLHWEGMNYATAEAGVFTADAIDGDYTLVRHLRPNNNMSRDDTLFKDDDGKAYFLSAANNNADSALYELSDDYTDVTRQIATLWAGSYREAPAIMRAGATYFIVNSGATNWDPNQQKYATASSMNGPWSALENLGDGSGFDTQTAFIFAVQGTKTTTYIYAGDRWQDPDLPSSKYIWLPIEVNGSKLVMNYYERWQLNVTTGEWSAGDSVGFLPRADFRLVSVDSEETSAEDGRATNAFDGSPSTLWHTQWQAAQPPPPHEIVIDLGQSYTLTRLRYTPRNDGISNGMVKDYELYVSDSPSAFGAAVKTGTFGGSTTPTTVDVSGATGRYVRFRALSEINGKAYTSVAELDFAGTVP